MNQRPVRVLRVISRLNVGGPGIQAINLSGRLASRGYQTLLVRGTEELREGSLNSLAEEMGVVPYGLPYLRRPVGLHDARAAGALVRLIRRFKPDVLHTHAAKAGTVGRVAAVLAGRRGPRVVVHTFHGHTLEGYFPEWQSRAFTRVERELARASSRIVAVSDEVRNDLVRLGVAPTEHIQVVPLGFDLKPFCMVAPDRQVRRAAFRAKFGIPQSACVVTLVARLVPIKRVDRFLDVAASLADLSGLHFLIVGDGANRGRLQRSPTALKVSGELTWAGLQGDMPSVMAASDIVVQTSDNEGTPVSLIEAHASALPVVATRVGGVASVVADGETGLLVQKEDERGLINAIRTLADDPDLRRRFGMSGKSLVRSRFSIARLVDDVDTLYTELLGLPGSPGDGRPLSRRKGPARRGCRNLVGEGI